MGRPPKGLGMPKRNKKKLDGPGQRRIGVGRPRKPPPDEGSGCERLDAARAIENSEACGVARCDGDRRKAQLELQQRGMVNELTDEPEMYELLEGHECLENLGELEAFTQFGLPASMNPRAMQPKVVLPPSPQPPRPPRAPHVRPRKRGAFMADVEAGIIPPPRGMRPDAC